jgi:GPH family glycoside/pentoside/hexuronide:cation symporter
MTGPPQDAPRLPLGVRLAYAAGSAAFGMKAVAISTVMLFYNQVLGLPSVWVSGAIGFALIVDAVASPVIGQVSDMWRSRWGRRHPFMYASALPAAASVWALLNPPAQLERGALFGWMVGCIIAARVSIALFEIPSASLLPELAPDYDQRTRLAGWRYLFGIIAPVVMIVFALTVLLRPFVNAMGQSMPGQLNPAGYASYGVALSAMIFVSILICTAGTHGQIRRLSRPEPHASLNDLLATIGGTLLNRNFLALTVAGVISGVGTGLVGGLGDYFNTFFWELEARQVSAITGSVGVTPLVAFMLAPALGQRLGKKRAIITTFALASLFGVAPISLRLLGLLPPNGAPVILPLLVVDALFGATLAIVGLILVTSMMADIVEDVQAATGRRSEGLLFSADTMLKQIVTGIGAMGTGLILQAVHFPERAVPGHVPADVLRHLALIYLPITAVTSGLAISVIAFYRTDRASHQSRLATIAGAATPLEPSL